jgi:Tfp pilus assembly protein PilF
MATAAGQVILPAVFIAVLVAGTFLALWRAPAIGFLGLWFFLILAPTSSIMPIADACFEHRMYLSLAAVAALATLGTYRIAGLAFASWTPPQRRGGWAFLALAACAAILALGIRTFERNEDYRTALAIWSDVVAQRPNNARAQLNLGEELTGAGRYADAERYLSEAMRLAPRDAQVRYALGNLMLRQGRVAEAMKFYRDALERRPAYAQVHNNFGMLLLDQGHPEDALKHLQAAVQAKPQRAQLWNNLGVVLRRMGRIDEAIAALQEAVRLDSAYAKAHARLAELLALRGRNDEAAAHYREALRLMPDYPLARQGLDNLPRSGEGTRHD